MRAEREDGEKKTRQRPPVAQEFIANGRITAANKLLLKTLSNDKKSLKLVSVKLGEVGVRFCSAAFIHSNSLPTRDAKRCQTAT